MSDDRHTLELRSVSTCRMRAIEPDAWAQRADESLAYQHGANYRTYKPERHIVGHASKAGPPEAMHIQRVPRVRRAGSQRRDNNQRNKPTYDQQEYMSAVGPASVSRTTCTLNIHESLLRVRAVKEMKETLAKAGEGGSLL